MTLKEFLEMNTNGLAMIDIYIYDKRGEYICCATKKTLLETLTEFITPQLLSFEIDDNDIYVKLDF